MKKAKFLALALAAVSVSSFAACGGDAEKKVRVIPREKTDAVLYDEVFGDFYDIYEGASAEVENVSKRYALMALSEAKMLESGAFVPTTSQGGNYAITRIAPNTSTGVLWGTDNYRYHNAVIATKATAEKGIKASERDEMKAKWAELKADSTKKGSDYEAWVKTYLTGKGYSFSDTYNISYTDDVSTWDILSTYYAEDAEKLVNVYDNLVEYDQLNKLQPALATSYDVSQDGLTYTFHLREGVKWVDKDGAQYGSATVKADDFVLGLQHLLDCAGGIEYLMYPVKNAAKYFAGECEFSEVGIKATNDTTLVYTLENPTPYFDTLLEYNLSAPINRAFYESKGGKVGAEFDPSDDAYVYGSSYDNILYCGPYICKQATEKNLYVFEANPEYWNKDAINVKKINYIYNDGTNALKVYNGFKEGTYAGAGLNSSALAQAKKDYGATLDTYKYVSGTDATAYVGFWNVGRTAFSTGKAFYSPKSDKEAERGRVALGNQHFRLALCFALDRANYNAQSVGSDLAALSLINSYTPGTFVSLSEDVTVKVNGTDHTFTAGTYYGEIMQYQLDADNIPIKVWDPTADGGIGSSAGFDGWYNVDNAKAQLALAINDLATAGVVIDAEHPIYIDQPYFSGGSEIYKNRAYSVRNSIETALEGKVKVNLIECKTQPDYLAVTYRFSSGATANFDVNLNSGWGPDYGDPSSYLDTMLPDGNGSMTKSIGLW